VTRYEPAAAGAQVTVSEAAPDGAHPDGSPAQTTETRPEPGVADSENVTGVPGAMLTTEASAEFVTVTTVAVGMAETTTVPERAPAIEAPLASSIVTLGVLVPALEGAQRTVAAPEGMHPVGRPLQANESPPEPPENVAAIVSVPPTSTVDADTWTSAPERSGDTVRPTTGESAATPFESVTSAET